MKNDLHMYDNPLISYNMNVSTTSKDAQSLFISVRKGGLVTESSFVLLEVETAEPSFLIGDKL
jgi:hypothetical protein